eukprot:GHVU01147044.1.p1 GENE.GHVU01147044.1~~GHVU01147044.1.p1  ORF type:complete len:130 (+),score=15.38 GHVU01147044.1:325-714(+)
MGDHIGMAEYARITAAIAADVAAAGTTGGAATAAVLESMFWEQFELLSREALFNAWYQGSVFKVVGAQKFKLDAGIMSFKNWIPNNKCCCWGEFPRVSCGCKSSECGPWKITEFPKPNTYRPWLCVTLT